MSGGTGKVYKNLDLLGNGLLQVASASLDTSAPNWGQVQAFVRGLSWKSAVRVATIANGALATAFANGQTVDGVVLATGNDILLKNQTTATENGIYTVNASGAPTRRADFAVGMDAKGAAVSVTEGTANGDKVFIQTVEPAIINTANLSFTQLGGGGATYVAGLGLSDTPTNTFNVDTGVASATGLEISADTVRIAATAAGAGLGGGGGTALIVNAGTGITTTGDAVNIDTSIVPRKFTNSATHTASATISLTHSLGHRDYVVSVCIDATGEDVTAGVDITKNLTTVDAVFSASQGSNTIRVTVIG